MECQIAAERPLAAPLCGELLSQRFVSLLVVAAGDRRRGVGTSLLKQAEKVCTRPKLFISCNRSNVAAQALFEKCGFVPSGRLWNLDVDDDEIFFVKFVSPAGAALPIDRPGKIRFL